MLPRVKGLLKKAMVLVFNIRATKNQERLSGRGLGGGSQGQEDSSIHDIHDFKKLPWLLQGD